jgi:regulator of sigma E protease
MAIILAGPFFNFIFAFVALWFVLVIGIKSLAPIVSDVKPGSIADQAGLASNQEIIGVNGKAIVSWHDFQYAFMPLVGSDMPVTLRVKSLSGGKEKTVFMSLAQWQLNAKNPDVLDSLGIKPFVPTIPPIVGEVVLDSPAYSAGLQPGDRIVSMDGNPIGDWLVLVDLVKKNPNQPIKLEFTRQGRHQKINFKIGRLEGSRGVEEGFLGLRSQRVDWPPHWLRLQREGPVQAMGTAFHQTLHLTGATFTFVGRLVMGKISIRSISGPVGIAQGAGESGRGGLPYYLSFLALVSISLGVLNLLPIPLLDGGQFVYCLIELIRRRPLSLQSKSIGLYLGMAMMVTLMFIALTNDLSRLT